jgi:hypothetical protein
LVDCTCRATARNRVAGSGDGDGNAPNARCLGLNFHREHHNADNVPERFRRAADFGDLMPKPDASLATLRIL